MAERDFAIAIDDEYVGNHCHTQSATEVAVGVEDDVILPAVVVHEGLHLLSVLAFIDADKREYVAYYEMVLPRLRPGGYIIADNTLWHGRVIETNTRESDLQTLGIKAFNDLVAQDERVEKVIVPVRDGLTLIRKKI